MMQPGQPGQPRPQYQVGQPPQPVMAGTYDQRAVVDVKTAQGGRFYNPEQVNRAPVPVATPKTQFMIDDKDWKEPDWSCTEQCCIACGYLPMIIPGCICCNMDTIQTYERGVVLRLGRQMHKGTLAGGLHLILPSVDRLLKIDIREDCIDLRAQRVLTSDSQDLIVDAVVWWKVFNASHALLVIENVRHALEQIAVAKIRDAIAEVTYDGLLRDRQLLMSSLQTKLDVATDPWGVKVTRVELTDVKPGQRLINILSQQLTTRRRADADMLAAAAQKEVALINANSTAEVQMIVSQTQAECKQIEASAVAAAKEIEADGERKAATGFKNAAAILAQAPGTMQLRFLTTLNQVGLSASNTILMPMEGTGSIVNATMANALRSQR